MCKFDVELFKRAIGIKSPSEEIAKETEETSEETAEPVVETPVEEEWIWVNGFKGMDKNMQCHNNFQYEIGKRYDMPEDATIEACSSGFHMCLNLDDVFSYINLGDGNRFFEVKALVRKSDRDLYRKGASKNPWQLTYSYTRGGLVATSSTDKLAAKSIEIVRELTIDEIFEHTDAKDWDARYKELAITVGLNSAQSIIYADELTALGYSLPFARWLSQNSKYEIAKAVGSQTDLSMDMKCLMIMNG
jgi:hypothetical protein